MSPEVGRRGCTSALCLATHSIYSGVVGIHTRSDEIIGAVDAFPQLRASAGRPGSLVGPRKPYIECKAAEVVIWGGDNSKQWRR